MLTFAIYFCVKLGLVQLYPAYICYKALKVNNQQEFGSLLTFWIVSISYLAVEYFSDIFLFWIPFYTEIKLIIVLWLILPQTQGASVFYTKYLDPFLHTHEEHIDNALLEIQAKLKETILLYSKQLIASLKRLISDTVFKGQEVTAEQNTVEPVQPTTPTAAETGGIINPYNLFSTLITSTANRFQQQEHQSPIVSPVVTDTPSPVIITASPTPTKLDRTDSHDSLHSFVNVKSADETTNSPQATWGGYLASYVWKQQQQQPVQDKKQD